MDPVIPFFLFGLTAGLLRLPSVGYAFVSVLPRADVEVLRMETF